MNTITHFKNNILSVLTHYSRILSVNYTPQDIATIQRRECQERERSLLIELIKLLKDPYAQLNTIIFLEERLQLYKSETKVISINDKTPKDELRRDLHMMKKEIYSRINNHDDSYLYNADKNIERSFTLSTILDYCRKHTTCFTGPVIINMVNILLRNEGNSTDAEREMVDNVERIVSFMGMGINNNVKMENTHFDGSMYDIYGNKNVQLSKQQKDER